MGWDRVQHTQPGTTTWIDKHRLYCYHILKFISNRRKGHSCGCTTALSGMHRYLYRVHCKTPPTSLCIDNTQNLHRSTMKLTHTRTVPVSKTKSQCAGTTPNTLISANRPKSILTSLNFVKNLITSTQYEPLTSSWFYIVTCDLIITNTKLVGCHLNNIDCAIEYTADLDSTMPSFTMPSLTGWFTFI